MRSSLRYILIAVALLAGAFFVACGGGDDGDGNGDADSSEPTVDQPVDNEDGGDDDVSDELRSLAEQFGITEVKVTYNLSGLGIGAEDFASEMVLYSKPPDRWRMDFVSADGEFSTIYDGNTTITCSSSGGEGQCFESPGGDAFGVPFLSIFTDPSQFDDLIDTSLGNVNVDQSSRKIAGQDAACFSFSGEIDGASGSGEYCFRDDGVLLLLRSDALADEAEFKLEATDVSNSVSDDDLKPPYDVGTLPGFEDIPGLEDFNPEDIPGLDGIPDAP